MTFDFDDAPDRRAGDSVKWNKYGSDDVIPMWVADMDFRSPPAVVEALAKRVEQGVFGYSAPLPALADAIGTYLAQRHGWQISPDWIVWLPGLVSGLNVVCRAVGQPGDAVMTAIPVYPPFRSAPKLSGRRVIEVALKQEGSHWGWNWPAMEAAVTADTRLLLLCSPHNPVGRVWTRQELMEISAFCERHDLVISSDEIHCDLALDEAGPHLPTAALSADIANRTITLMAPSKTWNVAGLGCAFAIIPDARLRHQVEVAARGIVPHINLLGYVAAEAAYRHGEPWRLALIDYLRGNRDMVMRELDGYRGVSVSPVQATYLAWIDVRALALAHPCKYFEEAGVGLSDGADFGMPGFLRLNFGCARPLLEEGIARFRRAIP